MRSQEIEASELYDLVVEREHQNPLVTGIISALAEHDTLTRHDLIATSTSTLEEIFGLPDHHPYLEPMPLVFARAIKAVAEFIAELERRHSEPDR